MRRYAIIFCLLLSAITAFAQDPESPQFDEPATHGGWYSTLGFGYYLWQASQYEDELETLDLPDFPPAMGLGLQWGYEGWGESLGHGMRLYLALGFANSTVWRGDRYALVSMGAIGPGATYLARLHEAVSFNLQGEILFHGWEANFISEQFAGRSRHTLLGGRLLGGFGFHLADAVRLDLLGGYAADAVALNKQYFGEMEKGDYEDIHYDHATAMLQFVFFQR